MAGAVIRPLQADDLSIASAIFDAALDDLSVRRHRAPDPRNAAAIERLFARLRASHPAGSAIAELDGRGVGFGIAVERERSWFLGFLFVDPDHQGIGLGRAILERILPAGGAAPWLASGGVLATCAEAIQPVSTGLYASLGMLPRDPIFVFVGHPDTGTLRSLAASVAGADFERIEADAGADALADILAALDEAAVGHRRTIDHRDDRAEGRRGVLYRDRGDGRALGYGYAQASGRMGPVYAADPSLLEGIVADLVGRFEIPGAWQLVVPGASAALPGLLRAGLRFDEPPIVHCATAPTLAVEGYLLRSFALP